MRYRAKLVALRSGLKAQVHAVLAKDGVRVDVADVFGKTGLELLRDTRLGTCYRMRVDSLVELIDACDGEVAWLSQAIAARLRHHPGYVAVQQIPGVGPTLAAVFVVEIGDVSRFAQAPQLCSWAGLTPQASRVRHHRGPRAHHQAGSRLCVGRGRRSNDCPTMGSCAATATASLPGAAGPSRSSRPPAGCSPWCSTAPRRPHPPPRPHRGVNRRERGSARNRRRALAACHDSRHLPAWSPV